MEDGVGGRWPSSWMMMWWMMMIGTLMVVKGDFESERSECSEALVGLATCLTYVEGSAKAPTPDCCTGLKQVIGKTPKCLCVLIKNRDNPQLGFKIDATRAMTLPSLCSVPANISHCPRLLNLSPDSKEAEIFKQFGNTTHPGSATSSADKGGGVASAATGSSPGGSGGGSSSSGVSWRINHQYFLGGRRWRWLGVVEEILLGGVVSALLLIPG